MHSVPALNKCLYSLLSPHSLATLPSFPPQGSRIPKPTFIPSLRGLFRRIGIGEEYNDHAYLTLRPLKAPIVFIRLIVAFMRMLGVYRVRKRKRGAGAGGGGRGKIQRTELG